MGLRMTYNEADTGANLIDRTLHNYRWTWDLIELEKSVGAIGINSSQG